MRKSNLVEDKKGPDLGLQARRRDHLRKCRLTSHPGTIVSVSGRGRSTWRLACRWRFRGSTTTMAAERRSRRCLAAVALLSRFAGHAHAFVPPVKPHRTSQYAHVTTAEQRSMLQPVSRGVPFRPPMWVSATTVSRPESVQSSASPGRERVIKDGVFTYVITAGAPDEDSTLKLLDQQKQVVATAVFRESRGSSLTLRDLEVASGERGKGFGRQAMLGVLEWFLNRGGRIGQVRMGSKAEAVGFFERLGLIAEGEPNVEGRVGMSGDLTRAFRSVQRLADSSSDSSTVLNVLGRLHHANGSFGVAADMYTRALGLRANDSAIFQNLGGAFASQGEHQMAFAAFQRAIDLAPEDRYTYFKLGRMYEQLATGKFKDAAEHALKCYEFYLEGEGGRNDTDALTMYGNLLVKRLAPDQAVEAYKRALAVNPSLYNVWFNLANAQLTLGQSAEAAESLRRTLHLNPNVTAARHLLRTLTAEERVMADSIDPKYVVELFDYYAETFDSHMKDSLLYTAPRMLRQEIRKVVNQTLVEEIGDAAGLLQHLNKTMRILDLGCGTGLVGAWFTDYSARMVGVDISSGMIEKAKKKLVYDELYVANLKDWLSDPNGAGAQEPFNMILCADVFQYLGALEGVLERVAALLSEKDGLLGFTVEELTTDIMQTAAEGPEAEAAAHGFMLGPTGRILYTKAYLDRALKQAGLVAETAIAYSPRMERGQPVPGFLYVVRRRRDGAI